MDSTATPRRVWISHIKVQDIRGFHQLSLSLDNGAGSLRQRMLLIGANGTGKTTLLRAIALGLSGRADADALLTAPIGPMVRRGQRQGSVQMVLRDEKGTRWSVRTVIEHGSKGDRVAAHDDERPQATPFVCAYGSGRALEGRTAGRGYRMADSVASLFRHDIPFEHTELTLRRLRDLLGPRAYDTLLRHMEAVLGFGDQDRIMLPAGGGVELEGPTVGGVIPIEALADGYRLSLLWLLDIFSWALRAGRLTGYATQPNPPSPGTPGGILMVDEIEQHLHPSMHTRLLSRLAHALPGMQILTTTHSPLVVLGLGSGLLVPLQRHGGGAVRVASQAPGRLDALSVEDIFTHPHLFGTSPYTPEIEDKLRRYERLVARRRARRSEQEVADLRALTRELNAMQLGGELLP